MNGTKSFFSISFLLFGLSFFAYGTAADNMISEAAKKASVSETISYLNKNIPTLKADADKKAAYAFLGSLQEQAGKFDDAKNSYVFAAGLEGHTNTEKLVISAVRCALNSGDFDSADSFLKSAVSESSDPEILANVRLYAQWVLLCRAENSVAAEKPVNTIKSFISDSSMKSVLPSVLLTLWHVTGKSDFSSKLKSLYPNSPEAKIASGTLNALPAPYWFFAPRNVKVTVTADDLKVGTSAPVKTSSSSGSSGKIAHLQLGLFRDETNAKNLRAKLIGKGFSARILTEKRSSGITYYIVAVDENALGTMRAELRNAGFECYPVFE